MGESEDADFFLLLLLKSVLPLKLKMLLLPVLREEEADDDDENNEVLEILEEAVRAVAVLNLLFLSSSSLLASISLPLPIDSSMKDSSCWKAFLLTLISF